MKIANLGRWAVGGYLIVGILVSLTQSGLAKSFEPECKGTVDHTLQQNATLWRAVNWLPALYANVIRGDMTLRAYLHGGFRCVETPVEALDSLSLLTGGFQPRESITAIMQKAADSLPDKGVKSGSRAAEVLNQLTRIEPIDGITLEIPPGWKQRDTTDLQNRMRGVLGRTGEVKEFTDQAQTTDWSWNAKVRLQTFGDLRVRGKLRTVEDLRNPSNLRQLADSFLESDFKILTDSKYTSIALISKSDEPDQNWPGAAHILQAVDERGKTWESRSYFFATPKRIVHLMLIFQKAPAAPYMDALEKARKSLSIAY